MLVCSQSLLLRRSCYCCLVTKSCPTLCDPMDCSPPGSSVCGISQARMLEWAAISFFRGSSWPRDWTHISCIGRRILYRWATRDALGERRSEVKSLRRVWLFVTPWTVAHQAPLSVGFSRQEYWSGLPFPSAGDLPHPGVESGSPALQAGALPSQPPEQCLFLSVIEWLRANTHSDVTSIWESYFILKSIFTTLWRLGKLVCNTYPVARPSQVAPVIKNPPANAGEVRDSGVIPGSGRPSGEGNVNSHQYSCLGDPMARGPWRATIHRVTKSMTEHACTHPANNQNWYRTPGLKAVGISSSCSMCPSGKGDFIW